jgi:hypothetical protein
MSVNIGWLCMCRIYMIKECFRVIRDDLNRED